MCSFSSQLISPLFLTLPKDNFPQNTTFLRKTPFSNKLFPQNTTFLRKICDKLSSLNTCRKYNCLKHDLPINLVSDGIIQSVFFQQRTSVCIFPAKNKSGQQTDFRENDITSELWKSNTTSKLRESNTTSELWKSNATSKLRESKTTNKLHILLIIWHLFP